MLEFIYVFQQLLFDQVNTKMQLEWTTAYQYRLNDCHTSGAGGLGAEAPPVLPPAHHQSIPLVPQPIWRQIHINTNIYNYQYKFKYIASRWLRPIGFPKPYHCRFILYFLYCSFFIFFYIFLIKPLTLAVFYCKQIGVAFVLSCL